MRTTLTIDDDLAGLLKRRARELGLPFTGYVEGENVTIVYQPAMPVVAHSTLSARRS